MMRRASQTVEHVLLDCQVYTAAHHEYLTATGRLRNPVLSRGQLGAMTNDIRGHTVIGNRSQPIHTTITTTPHFTLSLSLPIDTQLCLTAFTIQA